MNIYKQIYRQIKKYNTIVIARHIGADPDALGSQFALKEIILNLFPEKKVYCVGNPASRFKFFGNSDKSEELETKESLLIVLDTPDIKRIDNINIHNFNYIIKNITIRLDIRIAFCYTNHVARACAQAFGTSNEFTVLDLSPREREPLRI